MAEHHCTWWEYTGRYTASIGGISSPIMRDLKTGEEVSSRELPVGALWDCNQPANGRDDRRYLYPVGADGRSIACRLPDGRDWHIDSRASNCTMKDDAGHRCWIRHGTVGEVIHVDKVGNTCAAGAGSIAVPSFHGFLHHGVLRGC
ncbi:hypothetical protein Nham_2366 [Nitrobacter hamburgensis X14]|uniref:Uncharacterized protein n=1 Tax=Nitrobacter hamburgensis (strain DSM 10229 / NCIMB 13809 / X14) TaxID=323097 RepID=Q1QKT9_NITHX|nr:hypothetical protein [Nitrobacter hamburgensis]ABE63158.1 hypothetical protein Nham_2366 [Nitrobacter hamburgensis X14]